MHLELISPATLGERAPEFIALLRDAIEQGASLGFTLPVTDPELRDYWRKVGAELLEQRRLLLAAFDANGGLIGSAQLALESRANGRHRAEVQKVMVLAAQRGQGVGGGLMARVETEARGQGRRLLFLDTSAGEGGAVKFYERLGYEFAGSIPDYAADPDGRLVPNAIFYKRLA
ncbi:MAG: GCN5-related N-acetyltransferase [Lacunisphaera sp.]|nr:GCN5-related N-acetyltransferase [Lacunisphaera sp.]